MPAGLGVVDPTTGILIPGESDVSGSGAGGLFSDFLGRIVNPTITQIKAILVRLTALEAKAVLQATAATVVPNGAFTAFPYDATDITNTLAGAFAITRATGKLVCAKAGTYRLEADVNWATNVTGVRGVSINKALAATPTVFVVIQSSQQPAPANANLPQSYIRTFVTLAVGDVIQVQALQLSGANLALSSAHLEIKQLA